ncbi:cell wall protein IFF6 [Callorhinchus milii]|uniref:cell wall protein IFF6 n=1 Tax=Callorhinchus milii TaxID=7868 RepID=UPI001C3F653D|nr:cell wall protein IFF6 [Callorhinchus milii]
MEAVAVAQWLCLCAAVCSGSQANTAKQSRTPVHLFTLSKSTVQPHNTEGPVNTVLDTGHGNALVSTPSSSSKVGLSSSSGDSTVQLLNKTNTVRELNGSIANVTGDRAIQPLNETKVRVSTSTERPLSTSGLHAKDENGSIPGGLVTESPPSEAPPLVPNTENPQGVHNSSASQTPTATNPGVPTTAAGPDGTNHTIKSPQTIPSPTEDVVGSTETPQATVTFTTLSVKASSPPATVTTVVTQPTSMKPTTTKATTASSSTTTKRTTSTILSVNHSGENSANIKDSVHGKLDSISSKTKVDPLVVGIITVFFVIIGVLSILGFLKYRQRVNQPEFRRLHELPMDDMMEEDTPLSLYSY